MRITAPQLQLLVRATVLAAALMLALSADHAYAGHGEKHEAEPVAEESSVDATDAASRGIELGEFRIRSYYPVEAQKSTVDFALFATVKGERYAEMDQFVDEHRQKLRDQIITATRLAPLDVFEEPDLATFRRRILIRLRRAVPELEVDDVYVSDFKLMVKSL